MRVIDLQKIQVASSEIVRDINRRIVLNLIRSRQPVSRADLARLSGLQRSTVSLITDDLLEQRWIIEGPTGRLPRGRRPTFLRLNDARAIIGIDIRPEHTTLAVADVNGKFLAQEVLPTPPNPKTAVTEMIVRLRRLTEAFSGRMIEGIGISLPGRFDAETERLVFAPNLKWPMFDLKAPIARATGLDVEMENAANACVMAEVWFGAQNFRNLVVVTVSEGIGTGVFANGQLVRGLNGMAGEFGHVPLDPEGPPCGCGSRGCWEVFASNRAAVRYYSESSSRSGGPSFQDLLTLAEQGDALAGKALDRTARYLGRGMRMIVAGLAPEAIVVVGELTRGWNRFGPVIAEEVAAQVLPGGIAPRLIPAPEDGMARLRGTVALVLQKHFSAAG
jgi:predicted NBD/HSP70 family sugar kinase